MMVRSRCRSVPDSLRYQHSLERIRTTPYVLTEDDPESQDETCGEDGYKPTEETAHPFIIGHAQTDGKPKAAINADLQPV
jgi:hypothetical protein